MLALLLAVVPSVLVAAVLASRHPRDVRRLAAALALGGLVGLLVIEALPLVRQAGGREGDAWWLVAVFTTFGQAALPEETARLLALLVVCLPGRATRGAWVRAGAATGLGYAAFENSLVAVQHPDDLQLMAIRAATSLPAHAIFGLVMGGLACRGGPRAWLGAWLAALVLHVAYDAPLFLVARDGRLDSTTATAVAVFAVTLVGGWLGARALARQAAAADAGSREPPAAAR